MESLTHLYLHENHLSNLPHEIGKLTSLYQLYLGTNQLTSLPHEFGNLTSLSRLVISKNQLSNLSPNFVNLNKLEYLNLSDNPLKSPPIEIAKKGIGAIREYFESLEGEKRPLNEVKLLFVGEGDAGKTSLMKRIMGEKFDPNEDQTQGITIRPWEFSENESEIKANMWDFGGQVIMHSTHQFFLSKRSLYVLVLDARRDDRTEYWLKHIESFGGDSPILVVLNKIDKYPGYRVNELSLKSKYSSIMGFYRLSCADKQGIDDFVKDLRRYLSRVELISTIWGESWFKVKVSLDRMRDNFEKDFISQKEYDDICRDKGVTEQGQQNTLVNFLHDLGVVVHFSDFELEGLHVIDPKWITDGVYKIINSQVLADNYGVLDLCCMADILLQRKKEDYYYPPDKHHYIIKLMKKFELCYEIVDAATPRILIPDLLDVQEPEIDFDYDKSLRFRIDYDFLPKSIMPRFIVKMHKDVKKEAGVPIHWRTGVVLHDEAFGTTALVRADEDRSKIDIFITGDQKRDYLMVILFTLRTIHCSFEKLTAIEKVCMPDEPDLTASLKLLLTSEKQGLEKIPVEGSELLYDVRELLGMVKVENQTEEEILQILRKLVKDDDTEASYGERINDIVMLKPNFFGMGIDLNKLIEKMKLKRK